MALRTPALVPEPLVASLDQSLAFWHDRCTFSVRYARPQEGFAHLQLGSAHVMLEQAGVGRNRITADLERPLGRGINFQVSVPSVAPLVARLEAARWPLFTEPEIRY